MGRAYYLFRSGRLRRRQNTLYLEWEADGQTQRQAIPVEDVEALFAMGELDLNTRLLSFLGRHGISLHVFNYHGFYVGSSTPGRPEPPGRWWWPRPSIPRIPPAGSPWPEASWRAPSSICAATCFTTGARVCR